MAACFASSAASMTASRLISVSPTTRVFPETEGEEMAGMGGIEEEDEEEDEEESWCVSMPTQ